ncbi:YbaB/EbfC family nucleoid-associated protein [Proteiniclasticum sp. BAD-10]|uniref:Nucleoid-associated protein KCG48_10710 n=1 Tax=Proteiniclasticum sediminis TaxID=2804028 RepID=A0A941CS73_9CLOT|nr:YbaB/EbfC family nucleoid-associated protein [Proteiniclasticum sediminis]MBR0576803.1 YbaB/EbfC family nucleoid-associated protein [Proteiniclasticum sediminis]
MAKGFPGMGGGNMNNLLKQAQKMQKEMEKNQKELETKVYEATAGGGAITVKINGKKKLEEVKINPDVVDPEDVEMLEDLVLSAVNAAMQMADEEAEKVMGKLTGGMAGLF